LAEPLFPTRALVTGSRGFAGRHLSALLRAAGCEVWGLDLGPGTPAPAAGAAAAEAAPAEVGPGAAHERTGDVLDFERVRACVEEARPEVVFHLAARTAPRPTGPFDHRLFEVNVLGTRVVLEAVLAAGAKSRVLVTSSSAIYGAPPRAAQPIAEDAPAAPQTLYAASKFAQETLALVYHRSHGVPVVVTRAFNHTGPGERPEFAASGFARQLAEIEQGGGAARVRVGNLEAVRDIADVRDVVRGYVAAGLRGEPGGCYNVCSGVPRRMAEVLDGLRALCHRPVEVEIDPDRLQPSDVPYQCGTFARLEAETGWRPEIPFARTLADLLDDWRRIVAGGRQT
jgi:GDP-4-dehydro-6-deoxy-D-mannose reductase